MSEEPFDLDIEIALWTLEQGVEVCQRLERILSVDGFHCALGGSVLRDGESQKDLDVFIYPHKSSGEDFTELLTKVIRPHLDGDWAHHDHKHYNDLKKVYSGCIEGKRVDLFLLQ